VEACREVEGLVACGQRVPEAVLIEAPALRVVANVGVGYDDIDVTVCTCRGILVTKTAGVLEQTTADLAFSLLLAWPGALWKATATFAKGGGRNGSGDCCGALTSHARRSPFTASATSAKLWPGAVVDSLCASFTIHVTGPLKL
jgi:lactate dehydrogenase-like 2-hydroxyacid dehydrogenase